MALSPTEILTAMTTLDAPLKLSAAAWGSENLPDSSHRPFDRSVWKKAAEFGLQSTMMPPKYGGDGRSAVEAMLVFEGLGLGSPDNGTTFALASQTLAMQRGLAASASEAQADRWLRPLISGDAIGSFAMTEPDAGSDTGAITTTATEQPDGSFVLNGDKTWVTLGPECDVVVVFATTDPNKKHWGITAFVVDANLPGIERGQAISKMGLSNSPFGTMSFTNVVVSADDVLGKPGAGGAIFTNAVEGERAFLYAAQLGAMERLLDSSIHRARSRRAYGKPIGSFQAISHRIADMKLRHEASRLLLYKAAILYDQGDSLTMAAALAKLQTSESAVTSSVDAIRIYGAEGYTAQAGIEGELRDAIGGLSFSGTSEMQKNLIARLLRLERPI